MKTLTPAELDEIQARMVRRSRDLFIDMLESVLDADLAELVLDSACAACRRKIEALEAAIESLEKQVAWASSQSPDQMRKQIENLERIQALMGPLVGAYKDVSEASSTQEGAA